MPAEVARHVEVHADAPVGAEALLDARLVEPVEERLEGVQPLVAKEEVVLAELVGAVQAEHDLLPPRARLGAQHVDGVLAAADVGAALPHLAEPPALALHARRALLALRSAVPLVALRLQRELAGQLWWRARRRRRRRRHRWRRRRELRTAVLVALLADELGVGVALQTRRLVVEAGKRPGPIASAHLGWRCRGRG